MGGTVTHPDDEAVTVPFTRDELRDWLTTGPGAHLTAEQLAVSELPDDVLPPPSAPVSVMRNVRMPWDIDVAVKTAAEAAGVSVSEWIRDAVLARLAAETSGEATAAVELHIIAAAASRALGHLPHREAA
jgi:hypothetical protein